MYTWFHIYRPVGPDAKPELSLTPEQQLECRKFVVEMRAKKPIVIIDAYYDGEGRALCPAATGFTHHISPWGDIEPCPIIQFAKESIHDERPLREVFQQSAFLRDFRETAAQHTRGCIVLERPDLLEATRRAARREGHHRPPRRPRRTRRDGAAPQPIQPRPGNPRKVAGLSPRQVLLLQRLRHLRQALRRREVDRQPRASRRRQPELMQIGSKHSPWYANPTAANLVAVAAKSGIRARKRIVPAVSRNCGNL